MQSHAFQHPVPSSLPFQQFPSYASEADLAYPEQLQENGNGQNFPGYPFASFPEPASPPKKKKNKGNKKKKSKKAVDLSKEDMFRQSLSIRERRILSNYAGHFLGLLQMEIDEEIREAITKHRNYSLERLSDQGLVMLNARGSLVKLGAQQKKKALKKLAINPTLALGNSGGFVAALGAPDFAAPDANGMATPVLGFQEQNPTGEPQPEQHVEVLVRFAAEVEDYYQPQVQQPHAFMPGDLCWLRPQTEETMGALGVGGPTDDAHPAWKIHFEGVVDNCGRDFLVASFSFPAALEMMKTQELLSGMWRIDKGPSIVSYKRMVDAVKVITSHQFEGPAALRHIICRLHLHAKSPAQDSWDTSTPPEPDPRYNWRNFGWDLSDPELLNRDLFIDPRVNHVNVSPAVLEQARRLLQQQALNPSQQESIAQVLTNRMTLIQGPPGTGKTTTSVHLLKLWVQDLKQRPALASAFSNVAVDQMLGGLIQRGVAAVRIGDPERVNSELLAHTMKYREETHPQAPELAALKDQLRAIRSRLHMAESPHFLKELSMTYKRVKKLQKLIEDDILSSCDVILATCIGAGSTVLADRTFSLVLVDECTQATEPSCLIPLVKARPDAHVVLIGDQCQLPPTMSCDKLKYTGLKVSLFERMLQIPTVQTEQKASPGMEPAEGAVAMTSFSSTTMPFMGILPNRLLTQYRMHPLISEWPNRAFYDGNLADGITAENRIPPPGFPWPAAGPVCLVPSVFPEDQLEGKSKRNCGEAGAVFRVVQLLLASGQLSPADIGIVTPYVGQVRALRKLFGGGGSARGSRHHRRGGMEGAFERGENEELGIVVEEGDFANLEIMSVDGYQGREKEVIIFSCVRSNNNGNVGFLADRRRLNVAITRARRGLVVVGNPSTLESHPVWKAWLESMKAKRLLVEQSQIAEMLQQAQAARFHSGVAGPKPATAGPSSSPPQSPGRYAYSPSPSPPPYVRCAALMPAHQQHHPSLLYVHQ